MKDLTPRQMQVLRLLALGMTNRRIAGELGLSENAVRTDVERIQRAMRASTRGKGVGPHARRADPWGDGRMVAGTSFCVLTHVRERYMKGDTRHVIADCFVSRYADTVRVLAEGGRIGGGIVALSCDATGR
jgi:hypothetical protein